VASPAASINFFMSVSFDGTTITDATYLPRYVKHESVAERSLITLPIAREDGEVIVAERYGRKIIRLQGVIRGSSQADLESKIDTFTELFSRPEKNLDIDWNGATRRFVATCVRHDFDRDHYHLSAVPWTAEFVVPLGESQDTTSVTPADATGELVTYDGGANLGDTDFTLAGSKPPRPIISIADFDAGTSVKGFEYKNVDTGERLIVTYPGDWGNDRTILINCDAKTVTGTVVDGVLKALNFFGVFPRFKIGVNNVRITPGGIVNQKSHDDSTDENDADQAVNNTSVRYAQSFQVPYSDETFQGITLGMRKQGTPGTLTWRIETDSAGEPSGTLVDANATGTLAAASASSTMGYQSLYSSGAFGLDANTTYWIVLSAAATLDGSNLWRIAALSPGYYPRGHAMNSSDSGTTWGAYGTKTDLIFRVLFGGQPASMTPTHTVSYNKTYL
jgi:hypothetical protein